MINKRYWRIRIKWGNEDKNKVAWEEGHIGIWYGKWTTKDWERILKQGAGLQFREFQKISQPKWRGKLRRADFNTGKRFVSITEDDWVVVVFDDMLHLGQVKGGVKSDKSEWNEKGEIYKYRKVINKKSFRLKVLPPSYRLIPTAGRGNVHEFKNKTYKELITLLINSKREKSVILKIEKIPFMSWLDLLGPTGWESFCLGYLIIQEGFLPTGLLAGKTLPILDLVGGNKYGKIIAQCKKNSNPIHVPSEFLKVYNNIGGDVRAYLFAYGGISESVPKKIKVITKETIRKWLKTRKGKNYADMWNR